MFKLAQGMQQRGVPIDGVGLQFHWSLANHDSLASVAQNMARFHTLGLEVHITGPCFSLVLVDALMHTCRSTNVLVCLDSAFFFFLHNHSFVLELTRLAAVPTELDIKCTSGSTPCTPSLLNAQGELYAAILKTCLDAPNCKSFETWGVADNHSWLRADTAPLLFDTNYRPKPAVDALINLMLNHTRSA